MALQSTSRFSGINKLHDPVYKVPFGQVRDPNMVAIWNGAGDLDSALLTVDQIRGLKMLPLIMVPSTFVTVCTEQFNSSSALYFRGEVRVDFTLGLGNPLTNQHPANAMPWYGLGTQISPTSDLPARFVLKGAGGGGGPHHLLPSSGIFGVCLDLDSCNLVLNGYSAHTTHLIPEIKFLTNGSSLTLQHTSIQVARILDAGGCTLTVSDRTRLDAQNISLNPSFGVLNIHGRLITNWLSADTSLQTNGASLDVGVWEGGQLQVSGSDCKVSVGDMGNHTLTILSLRNRIEVSNANITLNPGANENIIIGSGNTILVNGARDTRIIGKNNTTDNGLGTVII